MNNQFDVKENVKQYYGEELQKTQDLKTSACCTVESLPKYVKEILPLIHDEIQNKYYGCGTTFPSDLEGLKILDIGCGTGRDSFENLDNWKSFHFSSGKKPTQYTIISENDNNFLQVKSISSASGLICKLKFDPSEYPLLKWKWKVSNIIPNANGKIKEGDDYPIRIFVMFDKDSNKISFLENLQNAAIKLISGYDPPYKSLCYVWANSETDSSHYCSPYTDDVMIICKQSGSEKCNQWIEEQTSIVKDYKKSFKENPTSIACIAVMADTDNTLSITQSFLRYIEILK